MKLARQVGAVVEISNGGEDYIGFTRLPGNVKATLLGDIATLF